ncbi:MAG: MqnA/MqnD/SBP family protein, partial [Planctomycetota bacterium]
RARVAIPGFLTSATLLLRLYAPDLPRGQMVPMLFDKILGAVETGEVDAGLIIHESRFTYERHGLVEHEDLGRWWEDEHGHPIPLGGILAHHRLGAERIEEVDAALRRSVELAREDPTRSRDFVREHAQELEDEVTAAHIGLYVNDFTVDLGDEGHAAVDYLLAQADARGLFEERPQ